MSSTDKMEVEKIPDATPSSAWLDENEKYCESSRGHEAGDGRTGNFGSCFYYNTPRKAK